jgi:O-antigen/teichoic acid export membrane protein
MAGVLSLAYIGVLARTLPLSDLGRFATVVALVLVVEKLFAFSTWKAIVQFGSGFQRIADSPRWRGLGLAGGGLDLLSTLAASTVSFLILVFLYPAFVDVESDLSTRLAVLLPVLSSVHPSALGFLKLKRRLVTQGLATISGPLIIFLLFIYLANSNARTLGIFVLAWAIGLVASRSIIVIAGLLDWKSLSDHLTLQSVKWPSNLVEPGFFRFLFFTKLDSILLAVRDTDVILVSYLVGPDATGLYKIARQTSAVIARASSPLGEAFLPVASEMQNRVHHKDSRALALKSAAFVGALMSAPLLAFMIFGNDLLDLAFGNGMSAAYLPAMLTIIAMLIFAIAQPLEPLLLSRGQSRSVTHVGFVALSLYISALLLLTGWWGLEGAAISLIVLHLSRLTFLLIAIFLPNRKESMQNGIADQSRVMFSNTVGNFKFRGSAGARNK